jgi:predicted PurR-regulated permease PerM
MTRVLFGFLGVFPAVELLSLFKLYIKNIEEIKTKREEPEYDRNCTLIDRRIPCSLP